MIFQVHILDPGGEANHLAYSGPDKTQAEEALDYAEMIGRQARLSVHPALHSCPLCGKPLTD